MWFKIPEGILKILSGDPREQNYFLSYTKVEFDFYTLICSQEYGGVFQKIHDMEYGVGSDV